MEQNIVDTPIFACYLLQLLVKSSHGKCIVTYVAIAIALVVAIIYS